MRKIYRIARVLFSVEGADNLACVSKMRAFGVFEYPHDTDDASLTFRFVQADRLPSMESAAREDSVLGVVPVSYFTADRACCLQMRPKGKPCHAFYYELGSKTIYSTAFFNAYMLQFALLKAYSLVCAPLHIFPIHASAVRFHGEAVLFLGGSGTGKSTHARLWTDHIEGCDLLNDDGPVLRMTDGRATAFGSLWSGKNPVYKDESNPVAAFVRLRQAPFNRIAKCSVLDGIAALMPSFPTVLTRNTLLAEHVYAGISEMLYKVPVYVMDCLPDKAAALLSHRTVFPPSGPLGI